MIKYEYKYPTTLTSLVDTLINGYATSQNTEREVDTSTAPEYDIEKTDSGFLVSIELPGIKKYGVDITIDNDSFTVTASRKETKYKQRFVLGKTNDKEAITAKMEDGMLEITVPNKKPVDPVKNLSKITID